MTKLMTARRWEVLVSVAASFAAGGYHGVSMRQIAQALGLNQGTLYHYFTSKDEALLAVCAVGQERSREDLCCALAQCSRFSDRLEAMFQLHINSLKDYGDFMRVFVDLRKHLPPTLREPLYQGWRAFRDCLDEALREAVRNGEISAEIEVRHARWMLTSIYKTLNELHLTREIEALRSYASVAGRIYLRGVSVC